MGQIGQYNLPPNPAKLSDSRAAAYIDRHGDGSWEVDALDPDVLATLIEQPIEELVDSDRLEALLDREEKDRSALRKAVGGITTRKMRLRRK